MSALHNALLAVSTMPLETVTDWMSNQTDAAKKILQGIMGVAILAVACWNMGRSKFSLGSVIMALVVAGLVTWIALNGGIEQVAAMFSEQSKSGNP